LDWIRLGGGGCVMVDCLDVLVLVLEVPSDLFRGDLLGARLRGGWGVWGGCWGVLGDSEDSRGGKDCAEGWMGLNG